MKVLYCNPSFWEYRLPFYVELNKLFEGEFHILYSTKYFLKNHRRLLDEIKTQLRNNAHPYDDEAVFDLHTFSFKHWHEGDKSISFPVALWRMIREVNPDVLITEGFFQWTPLVQLYGIVHQIPVFVGYERTLHTERNNSSFKTFIRKIQDKLICGYLVNGSETKKYLESIGVSSKKIHISGMSADSKGLRDAIKGFSESEKKAFKHKYKAGKNGLIYLFTGQLIVRKGIDHLLEVWKEHVSKYVEDSLVVVGDGELMDKCKQLCKDVPSVFLEGRVEYYNIYQFYAIADVYVLPTIEDNWSLVIPEAMSCGLPVATSIYNGCHPELVHEGENGVTFDTFNHDSILKALDFFHHKNLYEMGKKSIELEKMFNTENCAKREFEGICSQFKEKNKI